MLTPEDLDKAGELVGSVYSDVEAEMLDYLTAKMIEGDVAGQRSQTAIMLLAQSSTADLRGILDDHGAAIDEAVRREVSGALRKSDADDLAKIKRGLGVDLPAVTNRQTAATVAGVERILGRHNLQMEKAAKDAFIRCSTEAITQVNTGAMTAEQALHRAVRKLEREGVTVIQYQNEATGVKTVANKLDVAVRRHVRTQIAQDGARLTELRMDEAGIEFVEVSSHAGARPSHQDWEGRVYSRNGRKTVDGVTYEDFRTACHWGDVADGIYGANCRHSHGPWIPGTPRAYGKDPKHPSGLDNDEIYQLNQKQREMERSIRATKRELRGCEIEYEKTGSLEAQADSAKLKKKLQGQQSKMRDFIDEANAKGKAPVLQRSPRREWAGDMPRVKVPAVSGRKIDDVLGMPSVAKRIEGAGTSKTAIRKKVAAALADDGLTLQSFRWLTTKQQAAYIDAAIPTNMAKAKSKAGVFLDALKNTATDQKLYATAGGSASWAASIARAESDLLEWVGRGYASAVDHASHQAILVTSSRGYVTVGANALSHIEYDHPAEGGRPGVTIRGIIDAIEDPIGRTETRLDDYGRPSYKAVGRSVTAAINPDTNELITAWETEADDLRAIEKAKGKKRRRRR